MSKLSATEAKALADNWASKSTASNQEIFSLFEESDSLKKLVYQLKTSDLISLLKTPDLPTLPTEPQEKKLILHLGVDAAANSIQPFISMSASNDINDHYANAFRLNYLTRDKENYPFDGSGEPISHAEAVAYVSSWDEDATPSNIKEYFEFEDSEGKVEWFRYNTLKDHSSLFTFSLIEQFATLKRSCNLMFYMGAGNVNVSGKQLFKFKSVIDIRIPNPDVSNPDHVRFFERMNTCPYCCPEGTQNC